MKTLDLNKLKNDTSLEDTEIMSLSGKWFPLRIDLEDTDMAIKLNYRSDEYTYYLLQREDGQHILLRGIEE